MKILKQKKLPIKAIIFDFDATLMDTEDYWFLSDKRLLNEYGIDFTKAMKEKYIGKSIDDMVNDLCRIYNLNISIETVKDKKNRYFLDVSKGKIAMFPEMKKLYHQLKLLKIPMAVATGTDRHVVHQILEDNNILNDFDFVLTADQVKRGKPYPDIYLESSARLNINPENILVFEDSIYGVEAALNAGTMCVAIPYLLNNNLDDIFYKSHILIEKGMIGLNSELMIDWITG